MPVEIKELVIRAVVDKTAADPMGSDKNEVPGLAAATDSGGTQAIVQECVRQVMRILAKKKER